MQLPRHDARSFPRLQIEGRRAGARVLWILLGCLASMAFAGGALAQTGGSATLLWTAPGDDGDIGTATAYDLRYRTTPISGGDTLTWWNAATRVSGMPSPSPAGATDSVQVAGLNPALTYYFIIRAVDDASNWSGFSNVAVKSPAPDTTPPAAITDLETTPPASSAEAETTAARASETASTPESTPPADPPKPKP